MTRPNALGTGMVVLALSSCVVQGGSDIVTDTDPTKTPVVDSCAEGDVIVRTATGWACRKAFDPGRTPDVESCAPGQVVQRTDTGWACVTPGPDPTKTPIVTSCEPGFYTRMTENGWACSPLIGDLTGNVTGDVTGTLTGDVTGNLTGNVTGDVLGNLTGDVTGDLTGDVTGNVLGNLTGNVTGDVTGNHFGNVTGNVLGDLTGNVLGSLTGDVRGNVVGNLTGNVTGGLFGDVVGNVTGNVTGDVLGSVRGDVVGNLFGNVTGDVAGNVVGNVTGDLTGNVTGNVTGDVTGNLAGNVTGNVTGDVTGNLTGNVTGDVSGTASNVTGVVAVAHGGTGVASLPANALAIVNSSGNALGGLVPATPGTLLWSDGTSWQSRTPAEVSLARRSTAPVDLYVRADGSDTFCNGTVDAAAGAAPACAFATVQQALDALPDTLVHPAVIHVGAGTYRAGASGVVADVAKLAPAPISIVGTGTVVFTGATTDAPAVAVATSGLVATSVRSLVVSGIRFERFTGPAAMARASTVTFTNTSFESSNVGLHCVGASRCTVDGTTNALSNTTQGILVQDGSRMTMSGTVRSASNGVGLFVEHASDLTSTATLTIEDNGTFGIQSVRGARILNNGPTIIRRNGNYGVYLDQRASFIHNTSSLTVSTSRAGLPALAASNGSLLSLVSAQPISISCTGGSGSGLVGQFASVVSVAGASSLTISNCSYGANVEFHSTFMDNGGGGARNVSGASRANVLSYFMRGGMPYAWECGKGSYCE